MCDLVLSPETGLVLVPETGLVLVPETGLVLSPEVGAMTGLLFDRRHGEERSHLLFELVQVLSWGADCFVVPPSRSGARDRSRSIARDSRNDAVSLACLYWWGKGWEKLNSYSPLEWSVATEAQFMFCGWLPKEKKPKGE